MNIDIAIVCMALLVGALAARAWYGTGRMRKAFQAGVQQAEVNAEEVYEGAIESAYCKGLRDGRREGEKIARKKIEAGHVHEERAFQRGFIKGRKEGYHNAREGMNKRMHRRPHETS